MARMVILLIVGMALLGGCALLGETYSDIKDHPAQFHKEAQEISGAVQTVAGPSIPLSPVLGIGIGYGVAFLRRLYVNWRKREARR